MTTYPVMTPVQDIRFADRSIKIEFMCRYHQNIRYRTKEWGVSNVFPANEHTQMAEFGIEPMECNHTFKDDVWVLAFPYTNREED